MTTEIERRWIVNVPPPKIVAIPAYNIVQNYLPSGLRTRATSCDAAIDRTVTVYHLTVKKSISGMTNHEVEVAVPAEIYEAILPYRNRVMMKTRRIIPFDDLTIELDHFEDGSWIAEIELPSEDYPVAVPDWFGEEITGDREFTNYAMSRLVAGV